MSIYRPDSRASISGEFALVPGTMIRAEGQALVRTRTAQHLGVHPSTGQETDIFVGFAVASTVGAAFAEPYYNAVETLTVPSTGKIVLGRTPIQGQVLVLNHVTQEPVNGVTVTNDEISGLTPNLVVTITYKFLLSTLDRVSLFGNTQPGGFVGNYVDQIGYISHGPVFTSEFDASKNWAAATEVRLSAEGQITDQTGTGVVIPNATITHVPGVQIPFLGINLG